ncbi:MAG: hypothetical protein HQL56_09055, partial [Magnetococcales bacterium]|nr:hypothetical protein [Magnetococcales bacterium]
VVIMLAGRGYVVIMLAGRGLVVSMLVGGNLVVVVFAGSGLAADGFRVRRPTQPVDLGRFLRDSEILWGFRTDWIGNCTSRNTP